MSSIGQDLVKTKKLLNILLMQGGTNQSAYTLLYIATQNIQSFINQIYHLERLVQENDTQDYKTHFMYNNKHLKVVDYASIQ